jgi:TolB-like protein
MKTRMLVFLAILVSALAAPALDEMVSGRLPFARSSLAEIASAVLRDPPPALPADVPLMLAAVIGRCLEKDPADRYQRAGEVRAGLELIRPDTTTGPNIARPAALSPIRLRGMAVAAMLLLLVGVGGVGAFFAFRNMSPAASGPRTERAIAVLPFDNLSHDASQDYFSDGMTEALISNLGKIRALKVISRTTIMRYKGGERPTLPDIARELDVSTIIEGSVLTVGDRVRVSVNVVDGLSDRQLWTDSFERDLRDILSLQSDIARAVASRVNAQLTGVEKSRLSSTATVDPNAHDLYLRGRYLTHRGSPEALKKAIEYLQQATTAAPQLAPAWAALALAHQQRDI